MVGVVRSHARRVPGNVELGGRIIHIFGRRPVRIHRHRGRRGDVQARHGRQRRSHRPVAGTAIAVAIDGEHVAGHHALHVPGRRDVGGQAGGERNPVGRSGRGADLRCHIAVFIDAGVAGRRVARRRPGQADRLVGPRPVRGDREVIEVDRAAQDRHVQAQAHVPVGAVDQPGIFGVVGAGHRPRAQAVPRAAGVLLQHPLGGSVGTAVAGPDRQPAGLIHRGQFQDVIHRVEAHVVAGDQALGSAAVQGLGIGAGRNPRRLLDFEHAEIGRITGRNLDLERNLAAGVGLEAVQAADVGVVARIAVFARPGAGRHQHHGLGGQAARDVLCAAHLVRILPRAEHPQVVEIVGVQARDLERTANAGGIDIEEVFRRRLDGKAAQQRGQRPICREETAKQSAVRAPPRRGDLDADR